MKKQQNKRSDRSLGQMVKAKLYRKKSHKEAYTYTLTKKEKGKDIYIYILKKGKKKEEKNHQINKQIYL